MLFDSVQDLWRVAVVGVLTYGVLIAILRVSGKRTLSKLNAFDFVVTVALGSTLATILLSPDVTFSEGAAALALLVVLQFVATWLSVRWAPLRGLLKSAPTVVVREGRLLTEQMRRHRVTDTEVYQAVRAQGMGDLATVAAVVLETDGTFSVISGQQVGSGSALPAEVHPRRSARSLRR